MKFLITFLLLITANIASACSIPYSEITEETKIKNSKIAFIGEITNVTPNEITFIIKEDLKQQLNINDTFVFKRSSPSTCIISDFYIGQIWHFAGDSVIDPTWAVIRHNKKIIKKPIIKK